MDTQSIHQLTAFLAPFLPYLLKAGEKAAEEAGKKLGEAAWGRAKALWGKLRPKVESRPAAREAVQDLAAAPEDADAQAALRLQLKKLLTEDPALAAEITRLWQEAQAAGVAVIAGGTRSVAIGGSVTGSTIVTGDRNTVQRGKYNVSIGQADGVTIGDQNATPARKPSKGITLIPVDSSMVDSVGYDEERHLLQVVFTSGRVYCYEEVPPEVFQDLLEAESKGRYMRACIIDVYPYRRGPCRKR